VLGTSLLAGYITQVHVKFIEHQEKLHNTKHSYFLPKSQFISELSLVCLRGLDHGILKREKENAGVKNDLEKKRL